MPYTYALLGGLLGTYLLSSFAATAVRGSYAQLPPAAREIIQLAERRRERVARCAEWLGILLLLAGMFRFIRGVDPHTNVLLMCAGLAVFGLSNVLLSWSVNRIVASAAPGTSASGTARRSALIITTAEIGLLTLVCWIVGARFGWYERTPLPNGAQNAISDSAGKDHSVWLEESAALKELPILDPDYITGLIQTGRLRTRETGGKKFYNLDDIQNLKTRKAESIPD